GVFGLASEGAEQVVIASEVVSQPGGAKPVGDGAAAAGKEEAAEQRQQPPGVAAVQRGGQMADAGEQFGRQGPFDHSLAPLLATAGCKQRHRGRGAISRQRTLSCPLSDK